MKNLIKTSQKHSTSVDPVKATLSTPLCEHIAWPADGPNPGKILTTPGGNPALKLHQNVKYRNECLAFFFFTSLISFATYNAVNGVCSAGFMTTVFPQAKAGPSFHACMSNGKFHLKQKRFHFLKITSQKFIAATFTGIICPQTPTGS